MEKIKITSHQLMAITMTYVCGASTIIIASSAASLAKQDAWISAVVAALFGLIVIWLNTYLGGLYPDKTYVEVIQLLLGKWLGGFVVATFVFVCIGGAAQFVWYVGDFFTTQYMTETPTYIIDVLFVIVIVIAIFYGLEAIARASEIFFYIIIAMFILSMFLVMPNINIDNIFPVLEKGIVPVLKGSLPLLAFTVLPLIILNMIYPVNINVNDIKDAKKSMLKGYIIGMSITFISIVMCIFVLGSTITADVRYPVVFLTKEINVGIIFTRLEALIVIVWILTIFNNTLFYFYAGFLGLSQLLKLKDYKKILLPLGLIMAVISNFVYDSVPYEIDWDTNVWFPCIFTYGLILPVVLLIVYCIKNIKTGNKLNMK
ncbi:MAG TPA: spore gernimation protein KB [Clostridiales bacterium]|nr:MAG: hypothetical protein A2Y22_05125 [Clostridiales bacterium GWD2_32_59]HAN09563.1 spore gernimation protein KB [Clostridiales bacterium]